MLLHLNYTCTFTFTITLHYIPYHKITYIQTSRWYVRHYVRIMWQDGDHSKNMKKVIVLSLQSLHPKKCQLEQHPTSSNIKNRDQLNNSSNPLRLRQRPFTGQGLIRGFSIHQAGEGLLHLWLHAFWPLSPRSPRLCPACFGWGRSWSQRCHPGAVSIHGIHGSRKHMEKHGKNGAIQPGKHRHSGAKHMNSTVLGMVHGSYHDPNQQGNGSCESQVMSTTWLPQRASKNRRSRPKSYSSFSYPWRPVFINSLSSMVLSGHARTPGLQDSKTPKPFFLRSARQIC